MLLTSVLQGASKIDNNTVLSPQDLAEVLMVEKKFVWPFTCSYSCPSDDMVTPHIYLEKQEKSILSARNAQERAVWLFSHN